MKGKYLVMIVVMIMALLRKNIGNYCNYLMKKIESPLYNFIHELGGRTMYV